MITQLGNSDNKYKYKYKVFNDLLTNFLIVNSKEETENFKQMFYKIQRLYNILNRFVYNYKFKRAKIVVNSDMCLNELKEGDKNVISIIQNNSKYLKKFNHCSTARAGRKLLTQSFLRIAERLKIMLNQPDQIG